MNQLLIGIADKTERFIQLTKQPFLLLDDGPIADAFLASFPRAKLFDPAQHSFNPLKDIDYKRARDFAAAVYTASPQGENTLTVRNGKRSLAKMLLGATRLDELPTTTDAGGIEAQETIDDLLLSPVLRSVLCKGKQFPLNRGSVVARLNRAAIGDFDAFVLGSLLVQQFQGLVIVPDFGFYGRDFYTSLIRQNRLSLGLEFLSELTPRLQQLVLSIKDKTIYRTTREDAERLVFYTRHTEPRNITDLGEGEYLSSF
jgi:hypothetical protein